jgi:magnesium-transporting ATPase (P-type)
MDPSLLEQGLTILSLFALKDFIRPEVPLAIQTVKNAGIHVIMCTGDNIETASAVARECNILAEKERYSCMSGKEFREAVGGLQNIDGKEVVRNVKKFREIRK